MIAIIKTGGKQYVVKPGDKLKIEKLLKEVGEEFSFTDVLLTEKAGSVEVGAPFVKADVKAKVLSHGKGDKVVVYKYKSKKRESRKIGHRQPYTEVEILSIK
ncbi:MAG: 50S ribosomal protein L21 [Candidatus Staskawiczbacteria bacterium]|nr:50S ribosomal protein L21 [Candidatus Staskawiczbacteria bacterium]